MDSQANLVPYIGDNHLRSFTSFITNHVCWLMASQTNKRIEDISTVWILAKPEDPILSIYRNKKDLSFL